MSPGLRRLFWNGIPVAVIVGLVFVTVRGPSGLLRYWELNAQADVARQAWGQAELANNRVLLDLKHLSSDPVAVERMAADELGYAGPGAVLFYFAEDGSAVAGGDPASAPAP
jgi:hypothetical protein